MSKPRTADEPLFWIARGVLTMAHNIFLNSEEDEVNSTIGQLDAQYYDRKLGEDDASYRITEAKQQLLADILELPELENIPVIPINQASDEDLLIQLQENAQSVTIVKVRQAISVYFMGGDVDGAI